MESPNLAQKLTATVIIASLSFLFSASAQLAKGAGQRITGEAEVKKALLGMDMHGFSPSENLSWRECIQPDGETLYETPNEVVKGRLFINPEGLACFAYEDTGYNVASCYWTYRQGKGLRWESDTKTLGGEPQSVFVITKMITGIKSCKPESLVS